jgi:probable HAF family extracellular repeat protein
MLGPASAYEVSDLGLIEYAGSAAKAINDQEDVIGTLGSGKSDEFSPQANHSFRWRDSKVTDFGRSYAVFGINNKGQMAGLKYLPGFADDFSWLKVSPVLYTDGKWKSILPKGAVSGHAAALNDGELVAGQLHLANSQPNHLSPAVWSGTDVKLLEIPDPCISGVVQGINNAGQAVGFLQRVVSKPAAYKTYAVLWDTKGTTLLGSLPGAAGQSQAVSINNTGCILGVATFGSAAVVKYAQKLMAGKKPSTEPNLSFGGFLWDKGTLTALVTPEKPAIGIDVSKGYLPRAINDDRVVVGRATDFSGGDAAFIWHSSKMIALNTLIPEESGWTLTDAKGLNNLGQIVGQGKYNGQSHAFLLTPRSRN